MKDLKEQGCWTKSARYGWTLTDWRECYGQFRATTNSEETPQSRDGSGTSDSAWGNVGESGRHTTILTSA